MHVMCLEALFALPSTRLDERSDLPESPSLDRLSSCGPASDGLPSPPKEAEVPSQPQPPPEINRLRQLQRHTLISPDQKKQVPALLDRVRKYSAAADHSSLVKVGEEIEVNTTSLSVSLSCPLQLDHELPNRLRMVAAKLRDDDLAQTLLTVLKQVTSGVRHLHSCGVAHGGIVASAVLSNSDCTEFALMPSMSFNPGTMAGDVRDLGLLLLDMLEMTRRSRIIKMVTSGDRNGSSDKLFSKINELLVAEGHCVALRHLMACNTTTPLGYALQPKLMIDKFEQLIPRELVTERHEKALSDLTAPNTARGPPKVLLRQAIEKGCRDALLMAMAPIPAGLGCTIDEVVTDSGGGCALHYAAHVGSCAAIVHLLDLGADVNQAAASGNRPTAFAAINGQVAALKLLAGRGADLQATCRCNKMTIHVAASQGTRDVMDSLLELGQDVEQPDYDKCTPLYVACQWDNLPVVKYLIEHGADVNKLSDDTFYPLYTAAREGNIDTVKYLLQAGANGPQTLLLAAARSRHETVRLLVEQGVDASATLRLAVRKGQKGEAIKGLAAAGIDVTSGGRNGWTPLMAAARENNKDATRTLLGLTADVNASTASGFTAFRSAVWHRSLLAIKELAKAGAADVSTPNKHGETPIVEAKRRKDNELMAALAEACVESPRRSR